MSVLKKLLVSGLMVVLCNLGGVALATSFQNGDFSSGFSGWQGNAGGNITDPASGSLFTITSAQAASVQSDLVLFPVTLFQNFTLSSNATTISFFLQFQPTGPDDFVNAMLGDQAGVSTPIDLFAGKDPLSNNQFTADVSSLAGQDVVLYFSLFDLSYDPDPALFVPDVMKIDNIVIAQADSPAPVPEPSSIILIGVGVIGIAFLRRRIKIAL